MPKCLICESKYNPFIDFGNMPIANSFGSKEELTDEYTFQMKVGFCSNCNMVQLVSQPDREMMFHENYAFFSSTSDYIWSKATKDERDATLSISSIGFHTINIWMDEDGIKLDRILLTPEARYDPSGVNGGKGPKGSIRKGQATGQALP